MAAVPYAFGYSSATAVERQPIYATDVWMSISGLPLEASPRGSLLYAPAQATTTAPAAGTIARYTCSGLTAMIPGNFGDGASYQPVLTDALGKQIPYERSLWVADSELGVIQFAADPVSLGYSPPFALDYYRYTGATAANPGSGGGGITSPLTADLNAANFIIYNAAASELPNYKISGANVFNVRAELNSTELFSVGADAVAHVGESTSATNLYIGSTVVGNADSSLQIRNEGGGVNVMTAQYQQYNNDVDARIVFINASDTPYILLQDSQGGFAATYGSIDIRLLGEDNSIRTTSTFGGLEFLNNAETYKGVIISNGNPTTGLPPGMVVNDINVQANINAGLISVADIPNGRITRIIPESVACLNFIGYLTGVASVAATVMVGQKNDSITYYPVFAPNSGTQPLYADPSTTPLSYNPGTSTLTATNFSGLASSAAAATILDTPSGGSYYPVFVSGNGTGVTLRADVLTTPFAYNPGTGTLTTSIFSGALSGNATTATSSLNIAGGTGGAIPYQSSVNTTSLLANGAAGRVLTSQGGTAAPAWAAINISGGAGGSIPYQSAASTTALLANGATDYVLTSSGGTTGPIWGLTPGFVLLSTLTGTITGAATATTYVLNNIFNITYRNYKIILSFGENAFIAYPNVQLNGFTGTGTLPTVGSVIGSETTNGSLAPVSLTNQTLSTTPLILSGSCITNNQIELDVFNVGFTTTQANTVRITCNSVYNNPGVQGNRNVVASATTVATVTITGLSLGSVMGANNNPTYTAKVYGYR